MPFLSAGGAADPAAPSTKAIIDHARILCASRHVRLTFLRRTVLEMLAEACRRVAAYELLSTLSRRRNRKSGPPTVYRALDFLVKQGLCIRLESRKAYGASTHPENARSGIVFICVACSMATRAESETIATLLEGNAEALGFWIKHRVVELQGLCAGCLSSSRV